MAERDDLLASIAATTADYREGDLPAPTPEHVERWINQFDAAVQLPILREMDHVLGHTYFSLNRTIKFLRTVFRTENLAGKKPCAFWKDAAFLDIQGGGASQNEMLGLFSEILEKKCKLRATDCGSSPRAFVYLDDAVFTGNRVRRDLETWIANEAPAEATVHIVTIALHRGGQHYANGKLREAAIAAGKSIELNWWRAIELEDRKTYTSTSDVLRPVAIPDDKTVQAYVAGMSRSPHLRKAGQVGENGIFSSDAGRQVLELEFLKAGVRIREMCPNLNQYQRPLGNMVLETLGFGSLIVTFRNCPNNAPLALWVGDPWYPLFPRTTNKSTVMRRLAAKLFEDEC